LRKGAPPLTLQRRSETMEHGGGAGGGLAQVITQMLVFLAATCVVIPALRRARLSAAMGFLLIGVAMGPEVLGRLAQTWPWLSAFDLEEAAPTLLLAQFGVIFLLFIIGLEVSFDRLWRMRRYVFGLGLAQMTLSAAAIAGAALAFGVSLVVAAVLGLAFAMSSTALVLQLLRERGNIGSSAGRASFSVLLLQDLMVVPILFLVAALSEGTRAFNAGVGVALATAVISMALILLAGRLVLRPLFRWVAAPNSREIFVAAALLAAIGMAAAAEAAGLSMALGAFLAGLLLAETEFRYQIETDLDPFKDLLLGLFFVTVGMQIDVALLLREPLVILGAVAGLFALKAAIIAPLARAFGLTWPRAVETAFLLGSAGEFAFVVVAAASRGGAIPLLVAALSLFITPMTATLGGRIARAMGARTTAPNADAARQTGHVVIAGFGRVGQMLADILGPQEVGYLAIDSNTALVSELRKQDRQVFFGDASMRQVLASLGAGHAAAIVVTLNDSDAAERIVREASQAWPHVPVYARASDGEHARRLHAAGAALASPDTLEAALQLGEALLNGVGVPDEAARRIIDMRRKAEVAKALFSAS
jgi:CPA2 family monovalent cation:H+ antiporter-2